MENLSPEPSAVFFGSCCLLLLLAAISVVSFTLRHSSFFASFGLSAHLSYKLCKPTLWGVLKGQTALLHKYPHLFYWGHSYPIDAVGRYLQGCLDVQPVDIDSASAFFT